MAGFEKMFTQWAIFGLIAFSLFMFVFTTQADNNVVSSLANNTLINNTFGELGSDMEGFGDKANLSKTAFEKESPTATFGSLILFSIVSSGKVFTGMTIGVFNLLIMLPVSILGITAIVVSVLSAILVFKVLAKLWKLIKLGG